MAGSPIAALLPALPLRAATPGYNLAYVTFWADAGAQRLWGQHRDGRRIALGVVISRLQLGKRHVFLLALHRNCESGSVQPDLHRFMADAGSATHAVVIVDAAGVIELANPAFEEMTGHARADVTGRRLDTVLGRERAADECEWQRRPHGGHEVRRVASSVRRDGSRLHVEETVRPFANTVGGVDHYVITLRDVSERVAMAERIAYLAHHDSLTGLPNRALFADRLQREIARSVRHSSRFALLCLDLDGFKCVNDRDGHAAGDELLRTLAQQLRQSVRREDTVARLGGDEFAVILAGVAGRRDVETALTGLRAAPAAEVHIDAARLEPSVSIGVALFPDDGADERSLLRAADRAMYRAKRSGGNCRCFAADPI
jgi:diguanylate cyclase (GGDEF)-like protein/PAS domain S-box-containing protein